MSRFEFSKKHQIEIEEDSLRKALIDLELARYYARRGEFTKCKEIISKFAKVTRTIILQAYSLH